MDRGTRLEQLRVRMVGDRQPPQTSRLSLWRDAFFGTGSKATEGGCRIFFKLWLCGICGKRLFKHKLFKHQLFKQQFVKYQLFKHQLFHLFHQQPFGQQLFKHKLKQLFKQQLWGARGSR